MVDPGGAGGTAPPDVSSIGRLAAELARITTTPGFLGVVGQFSAADPATRLETVWDVATVENLTARGIPVTETFRFAPRTFDEPGVTEPLVTFKDGRGSIAYNGVILAVTARDREKPGDTEETGNER